MSIVSDTLARIKPSPTMAVTAKVAELRRAGQNIIGLGAGEPDFDTPDHIKAAAIAAINRGETKYTAVGGTPELKAAIAEKFKKQNGIDYAESEIFASCGGKHSIYNAMMATLNVGDEVLIPTPYWVSYPDIVLLAGGTPKFIPASLDTDFKITPEQLRAAITPKTKWLIFNSPSNPSGAAYTRAEIKALTDVLLDFPHVWIFSDDIYEHIVYDGFEFTTPVQVEPKLKDRAITMNGIAKAYAMTGWRIGYVGGPADVIKAMSKVQSQSTSNPSSISQAAAIEAVTGPHDFLADWVATFKSRRDLVVEMINAAEGLTCPVPQGAFYVYPDCSAMIGAKTPDGKTLEGDGDVVTFLLESAGVAAVQGEAFGLSPNFRVSYATATDVLEDACARIQKACGELS
ncbi:MAG: pyridoxal phosphate-dependent aminotransferase [Pseudomonadota bacterium]